MKPIFRPRLRSRYALVAGATLLCVTSGVPERGAESTPVSLKDPSHLLLPSAIYAVPGNEVNIYLDNIVLAPPGRNYLFSIDCEKGRQDSDRWTHTPQAAEAGTLPWKVEVRDLDDQVVATGSTTVHVAAPDAGQGKAIRFLCIGDSLTHADVYPAELVKLFARPGNPTFTLVGTNHTPGSLPGDVHEGYAGWRIQDFLQHFEPNPDAGNATKRSSPFIFNEGGKPDFNLARYIHDDLGGQAPDYIFIFLGTNDIFASVTEQNRDQAEDAIVEQAETLVDRWHAAAPLTRIGISGPVPPSTQDAFGQNYGTKYTQWWFRKSQHLLDEKLMKRFEGREKEGIYSVPLFTNIDSMHDYQMATVPVSARNGTMVTRSINALHPDKPGYLHFADIIYAWIKNTLPPGTADATTASAPAKSR